MNLRIEPIGLVLAVIYAIACWCTRQVSLDQFYLPAGIRVAAVLLCPPRLWPYLFLGEYAYFAQLRYPMVEKYGVAWAILASALLMPTVALIVHLHRRMVAATTNTWLISVAASSAIAISLLNRSFSHFLWPTPPDNPFFATVARYIAGDFIGILTVVPLALLWASRHREPTWSSEVLRPAGLALATMVLLGVFAALVSTESTTAKTSLQVLMALPAIALTCVLGWRGAAIAVPSLNLIIGLTTPKPYPSAFDSTAFTTQLIVGIAGIALLALGSRITLYYHRYRARDDSEKKSIKLARSSHVASEMGLRERALHLRKIGDGMETSIVEVVNWLKLQGHHEVADNLLHTTHTHSRQFRAQASMVYPTALDQLGLYVALQAGGVRQEWDATHRVTHPRLEGDPCQLSLGLQLAAYRAMTEAVSLLLDCETGQIQVRARCGRCGTSSGILVTVGLLDSSHTLSEATMTTAIERMAGRALAYDGVVQCRRNRVRLLLTERHTFSARDTAQGEWTDRFGSMDNKQALI